MKYLKFRYFYPPRPETKITSDQLGKYEKKFLAQPKLNGACAEIYISPTNDIRNFGRHKNENLTNFKIKDEEFAKLNKTGKWMVLVGEYMNKNKKGLDGKPWNHKFVIFDILVYKNDYLIGTTYQERIKILDDIFGTVDYNEYLYKISDNIYRVKTFYDNFLNIWKKIIKIDMLEGLVLKKLISKLERAYREKNNVNSLLKARRPEKNYHF